ncbi:hypothetical protein JW960_20535, partial [candidate division KSB1 bacterium]|nr:hypothetical protein [candidate division KSB1 bacterium]
QRLNGTKHQRTFLGLNKTSHHLWWWSFDLLMSTSAHHRFKPTLFVGLNIFSTAHIKSKQFSIQRWRLN